MGIVDPPPLLVKKKGGTLALAFVRFAGPRDELVVGERWFEFRKLRGQDFLKANEICSALLQIRGDCLLAMVPSVWTIRRVVVPNVERDDFYGGEHEAQHPKNPSGRCLVTLSRWPRNMKFGGSSFPWLSC